MHSSESLDKDLTFIAGGGTRSKIGGSEFGKIYEVGRGIYDKKKIIDSHDMPI